MAYAIWPGSPWIPYAYEPVRAVEEIRNGGPAFVRTVAVSSRERRIYSLPEQLDETDRDAIDAFVRARGVTRDRFLFEDPHEVARTAVALGTGDGSTTVFSLPTTPTDPDAGFYPKQGTLVGKVDGVVATVTSYDTDARTVTFAAAPANGKPVTCDFTGLRLVRLRAAPRMQGVTVRQWGYEAQIEETDPE